MGKVKLEKKLSRKGWIYRYLPACQLHKARLQDEDSLGKRATQHRSFQQPAINTCPMQESTTAVKAPLKLEYFDYIRNNLTLSTL